jgi:chromosomal replication initiation ATPase DnaA
MDQFAIEPGRPPRDLQRPPRKSRRQTIAARETRLFQAIEAALSVRRAELCARTRGRHDIALARQTGMYLARIALGMTLADAGLLFGRDRTTAAHACRLVEDLRDDPRFDAMLDLMEAFVLHHETLCGSDRR